MTPTLPAVALAAALAALAAPLLAQEAAEGAAPEAGAPEAGAPEAAAEEAPAATAGEAAVDPASIVIPDMTLGAEDAPIEVIEYGSFTCPHCAAWHADAYPQLKEEWIDTGRVRFTFREVYFDRFGLWASMIARCGGEMRFFGLHDQIYETQREWIGDGDPATIAANLRQMGKAAGMSEATLEACLSDEAQARALVAWYEGNAEADGISATPTFLIDGETHSNMAWDDFEAILEERLAAQ